MEDVSHTSLDRWGQWLGARTSAVGIRGYSELARIVGCSYQSISAWMNMAEPPRKMRKGFSVKLAAALRVDLKTLFVDWRTMDPKTAPWAVGSDDGEVAKAVIINGLDKLKPRDLRAIAGVVDAALNG